MKEIGIMALIILFAIALAITGARLSTNTLAHRCEALSGEIGRVTIWRKGECLVEIAPDMFIVQDDIVYYLDHVEPVEKVKGE